MIEEKRFTNRSPYQRKLETSCKEDDPFYEFKTKMNKFYENPLNGEKFYNMIIDMISKEAKIDLSLYRTNFLHRRIYYRIMKLNLATYSQYIEFLQRDKAEVQKFVESFTIHVTEFFRDVAPFTYLEQVLIPKIIEEKKFNSESKNTLTILSAPCSTGEEPYSIAIILDQLKKKKLIPESMNIQLYASDIDQGVLDFAQQGIYSKETLKRVPQEILDRYFRTIDEKHYQIKPLVKQHITWIQHDLLKPIPIKNIDLVVCRNFLIYISKDSQNIVIDNLVKSMTPTAYLMLGKTEGFPLISTKAFIPENIKEHIYRIAAKPGNSNKEGC